MEEGQCVGADHVSRVVAQDDTHPAHQSRAEQSRMASVPYGATFHGDVNNVRTYVRIHTVQNPVNLSKTQ